MEQKKLKQLLSEMSLREKIGQMIQLTGIYFDDDAVLTGEVGEDQPPQWVTQYAGSVLGMIGAEKLRGMPHAPQTPDTGMERRMLPSAPYSIAVYGRCHTWVQNHSSDSFGTGLFVSSGTG